ncbi:MAG TPA: YetF domain-containing protein [Flavipsychrobacter sp.]|nr:YetF domain-containing protein [Flavipsychrobacter sp.]
MNPVARGIIIYLFLMLVFRLSGKRTLANTTPFEFVLLLIISEVTQQALVGQDFSITSSMVLILTLIATDLFFSIIKTRFPLFEKVSEGTPMILAMHGKPLKQRMKKTRVSEDDILEAARSIHGLERMEQIKYAVLEIDGSISIIPEGDEGK